MTGGGDTSSYAGSITGLGALTTVHLAMIAVFAVLVVLAIIYGMRLRAKRKAGEAEVRAHNATVEREAPPPTQAPVAGETPVARLPEEVGEPQPMAPPLAPPAPPAASAPVERAPVERAPIEREAVERGTVERERVEDTPPERSPLADEPIAAAAPFDASPATIASDLEAPAAPAPAPTPVEAGYKLTDLKGLGPKVAARLEELGVTSVAALAAMSDADAAALSAELGPFAGRMERDRWREQARLLAAGDRAAFEAAFGKL